MVPPIIRRTFQLMAPGTADSGRIPEMRKIAATVRTIQTRFAENRIIRTYIRRNSTSARSFICLSFLSC